ncbi:hypothetical protein FKG96_12370 [Olivibacter sp. LS-1]|uniref:hypothetical protein n=1 Tax=Olivibacter sp. LS-1 TaxID=2592345 RepID=UPI0011EB195F|nr:hypothetical protein [Olivibacter sp. LS-1]QEL01567.1 hypothetical protein FKG96_12370 [Olivibacter sp. LS-1]
MEPKNKYQLDGKRYYPNNHHHTVIAVLTGLDIVDIIDASPLNDHWGGQTFVKTFNKLGFNTNHRFIKFDRDTIYPCLMRTKRTDIKEPYWYCFPYYDGWVYFEGYCYGFEYFFAMYNNLRITSMLQVWI